jgi:hypothetical protein
MDCPMMEMLQPREGESGHISAFVHMGTAIKLQATVFTQLEFKKEFKILIANSFKFNFFSIALFVCLVCISLISTNLAITLHLLVQL